MDKIQMVDLGRQYEKIKAEVDEAILRVIKTSAFINGPDVKCFEQELGKYMGSEHCIACANGTDALQIAMMALGLKAGDEILVPTFTYVATVEAAAVLGIRPVFIDADPDTFNIAIKQIERHITPRTKAIVPVHLYGQCACMEDIMEIAGKHNLFVIEDAAQALGAEYTFGNRKEKASTMGDIGITSFFPSKNLGCYGDGGALFTKNTALAQKIRMIASHGQQKKYYHDIIGVNSRLDTLQAAILREKLKKLDTYNHARQQVAAFYDKAFADHPQIQIPRREPRSTHVFHQYTVKVSGSNRDDFKKHLQEKGIPSMIYYPLPVHLQKAYSYLGYKKGDFPVAEDLSEKVISLPIHTEMDEEQLNWITEHTLKYFNSL